MHLSGTDPMENKYNLPLCHPCDPEYEYNLPVNPVSMRLVILIVCFCCLSLPSVTNLNGSAVSDSEREDAERFFIRYYLDHPAGEQPYR